VFIRACLSLRTVALILSASQGPRSLSCCLFPSLPVFLRLSNTCKYIITDIDQIRVILEILVGYTVASSNVMDAM